MATAYNVQPDRAREFERIVGSNPVLESVLALVERVAPTQSAVLVLGETGSGKELIARAIHNLRPRYDRPFVTLNCAAIPHDLLESELFGHEKGAFTGAIAQKIGRFEMPIGARCFWTKWETFLRCCSPSCSVFCKSRSSSVPYSLA